MAGRKAGEVIVIEGNPEELLRVALDSEDPADAVFNLAKQLRDSGMQGAEPEELYMRELVSHDQARGCASSYAFFTRSMLT